MHIRRRRWAAQTALAIVLFAPLSSHAQLEPEAWTILKESLNANPPDPAPVIYVLKKYYQAVEQEKLADTWLRSLALHAAGKMEEKRKKLASVLDAFNRTVAAGETATLQARKFIALRDEVIKRPIGQNEIVASASAFVERLRKLKAADRNLLKEFGKLAKDRISTVVK